MLVTKGIGFLKADLTTVVKSQFNLEKENIS
jgi:hypothetical protein